MGNYFTTTTTSAVTPEEALKTLVTIPTQFDLLWTPEQNDTEYTWIDVGAGQYGTVQYAEIPNMKWTKPGGDYYYGMFMRGVKHDPLPEVYRGRGKNMKNIKVARKTIYIDKLASLRLPRAISPSHQIDNYDKLLTVKHEIDILLRLYHYCHREWTGSFGENIPCLYGGRVFMNPDSGQIPYIMIYSEFIEDAYSLEHALRNARIPLDDVVQRVLPPIFEVVTALNKIGIRHNDLHTGNILLQRTDGGGHRVVIIDFGFGCSQPNNCDSLEPALQGGIDNPFTDCARIISCILRDLTVNIDLPSPSWPSLAFLYEKFNPNQYTYPDNRYYCENRYYLYILCNWLLLCLLNQTLGKWDMSLQEIRRHQDDKPSQLFLDVDITKPPVADVEMAAAGVTP